MNCDICGKVLRANTYVRLDDNYKDGRRAHVKCFVKKTFAELEVQK